MSFKSKFNKYARKIAKVITYFDDEGNGKDPLLDILRRLDQKAPIIFDVGANIGQSVKNFKRYFPYGKIYSFEPSAKAYKELEKVSNQYKNVEPYQIALGSQEAQMKIYENSSSDMNSFLEMGKNGSGSVIGESIVEVTTIDQFCARNNIQKIHILKIDAQGYDFEVIKGAKEMILANKIELLYFEIIFSEMYKGVPRFSEIYDFLIDHGFSLVSLYNFYYQKNLAGWTDGLFIHQSAIR
jgi:FkbM family methyltransferase